MHVHLIDGTYELFRYHFAAPSHVTASGQEVGAVRGVLGSMSQMIEGGATHIGIATDHVIESFRNDMWTDYKDGSNIDPVIKSQFELLEQVLVAAGFCVWPMIEFEADDALAAAAHQLARDPEVEQTIICTPDKDLAQCVSDQQGILQLDRRKDVRYDENGVVEKFGVRPESIPDYLALVGDSADGFPGLPGWGAKSASTALFRYGKFENIPPDADDWDIKVRGAKKLAATLQDNLDLAFLFREIATVRYDSLDSVTPSQLYWDEPKQGFEELMHGLESDRHATRLLSLASNG